MAQSTDKVSELSVTKAIAGVVQHQRLAVPLLAALTDGSRETIDERRRSMGPIQVWQPGRRGADLVFRHEQDSHAQLIVENKLDGGPAQWTPIAYCDEAGAAAGDDEAQAYARDIAHAVQDAHQMPFGVAVHDIRTCECTWRHTQVKDGRAACAIPQLDYYRYWRNWLPEHLRGDSTGETIFVFLAAGRADLRRRYPDIRSAHRWTVVRYAQFLTRMVPATPTQLTDAEGAALANLYYQMWWAISCPEADTLPTCVRTVVEAAGERGQDRGKL